MATPIERWCRSCGGRIEALPGPADPVECPYCRVRAPLGGAIAQGVRGLLIRNRKLWFILPAVLLLLLVGVGFWYRRFLLSGLDLVGEATGGRTSALLAVAAIVLVIAGLLIWMLLPFFLYFGLKDLRRRTAELAHTTRLCAHHLAQARAERQEVLRPSPPAQPQVPASATDLRSPGRAESP